MFALFRNGQYVNDFAVGGKNQNKLYLHNVFPYF